MVKCPKCNEEIDHLENFVPVLERYDFTSNKEDKAHYDFVEDLKTEGEEEYCCPKCSELLCTSESEAIKILKGEKN